MKHLATGNPSLREAWLSFTPYSLFAYENTIFYGISAMRFNFSLFSLLGLPLMPNWPLGR